MISRIDDVIRKSIVELGKEGSIVKMRLKELTKDVNRAAQLVLKDYTHKPARINHLLSDIPFDDLIDTEGISKLLFNKNSDETIQPRGFRLLNKINLGEEKTEELINNLKGLNNLFNTGRSDLLAILKDEQVTDYFQEELNKLRENIMVGKRI